MVANIPDGENGFLAINTILLQTSVPACTSLKSEVKLGIKTHVGNVRFFVPIDVHIVVIKTFGCRT